MTVYTSPAFDQGLSTSYTMNLSHHTLSSQIYERSNPVNLGQTNKDSLSTCSILDSHCKSQEALAFECC
ncbi:hypothetical protein Scep_010476 [Stephania cephalantha]|uniref:Uncharacterized protein n=1 Tax=Stephania cephalantha TaxID=152367 RepID=A0AAP0JW50_9MAGN